MNIFEKIYSIFAVFFAIGLMACLAVFPELRQPNALIAVCTAGFLINMGLMFIVLRDIFLRQFNNQGIKFLWLILVLLFWPTIIYYLPKHGFQTRTS